jgi:hypothetical protein
MATPVVYGSKEWEEQNAKEIANRPQVLPLNKRHYFTPQELQDIRDEKTEALAEIRGPYGLENLN